MKLRIEAESEGEIRAKAPELLARLAKALVAHAPDLADALGNASLDRGRQPPELKHAALQESFQNVHKRYVDMLDRLLADVGAALDEHVDSMMKSSPDYTTGIIDIESAAYEKAKEQLAVFGYADVDFAEGGKLYGMSMSDLRDLLKQLTTQRTG